MVLCFGGLYLKYLGLYGGNYPWGDQRASERRGGSRQSLWYEPFSNLPKNYFT
ncbi:Uncharacterised protein [Vibrio cholerae]|nr:Uncharacterised protein [Vibrio cholerae]